MKKTELRFLFLIPIIVLFISCDKNQIYDKFQPIPKLGWNKDSVIVFDISVTDTLQNQNLYINVRNDVKYKYSNLWLFVEIIQPGSSELTDTFEITLADQSGKWLGDGFGGLKTRKAIYKRNIYFPVSGNYRINIQHGMREDILNGITNIGVRLEKLE